MCLNFTGQFNENEEGHGKDKGYVYVCVDTCLYVWLFHPKHLIMRLVCARIGTMAPDLLTKIVWRGFQDMKNESGPKNLD